MKTGTILTLVLAVAASGYLAYSQAPALFGLLEQGVKAELLKKKAPRTIPGSYIGKNLRGEDWVDCKALEQRLSADILKSLKGADKASVQAFIAEPQNRLLLAQWNVAHAENAVAADENEKARASISQDIEKHKKALSELEGQLTEASGLPLESLERRIETEGEYIAGRMAELASPRSMKEALDSTTGAAKLLQQVTNNLDWMEQIAYTGECIRPGRAMAILAAIAKSDKNLAYKKMEREIATATAVEWAKSGWNFNKALARADFYTKHWKNDRLHTEFDTVPFWMRRMICGSKGDNPYGEVESLQWQLDNVNLPTGRYAGCCWQCGYIRDNLFGDSIHGPMYYNAYGDIYGNNAARRTFEVGGVCGALSHFGAFAAIANGIPAMTAGEPGHCAYIVFSNNKWTPGYSLSWKRGLHWQVWKGIHKYASLHMATELYSPEQQGKTQLSDACRTLGKLYAAAGDKDKALSCLTTAVEEQPLNYPAWVDYANFLAEQMPEDAAAWKQLNTSACTILAPLYPEMAAELMKLHVYPGLQKLKLPAAELMECFAAFWKPLHEMGPDRWDIEALCNAQRDTLKSTGEDATKSALALFEMVLGECANKEKYASVILSWGNGIASGMKPEVQQQFLKATLTGLSKGGSMKADARDKMLGEALAGAAKMRDLSSFQAIGKMLSEKYRKNRLPKWEPFPGKLASQGGLLYTSTSAHDTPAERWGVMEPFGGRFHTASEVNPWVVVQMPKTVYITGVVAISTAGHNNRRLHDMKVQYSESGRDDDWHDAGAFPAPSTKEINRLDLQQSKPRARFIRIIRGGNGKDVFHLNGIFVYGEQAA